jgi:tripartite-type tricarboxylate transporter receptor subunit TctC
MKPSIGTRLAALAFALIAIAPAAQAQSYPTKPVRLILTYSGGIDAIARLIAVRMTDSLGQPVVVEGQAGAGGSIGATMVARAAPDGYTILSSTGSTQVQRGFLVKNVPYDAVKDFTPITLSWETMIVVGATNSAPFNTFREMIAYAKANPGKISYGTSGLGTSHHLALEQINLLAGTNIVHIPYKGGDQVITDVIAGRIQASSSPLFSLEPSVSAGKARYLAMVNAKRFEGAPEVPTVREIIPTFEAPPLWSGFFGPAKLPPAIVKRLHAEITKIVGSTEVRARLFAGGLLMVNSTPEELAQAIKRDIQTVAGIVNKAKIQPE